MPGSHLDLTLDFTSDYDYDFYERDRNAPPICGHLSYKTWNYGLYPPPPQHTITTTLTRPSPGSPVVDFTHSTANTLWQRQPSHHHNTVWTPAEDYIYTVKALPSIGEGTSMPKVKWNNNGYGKVLIVHHTHLFQAISVRSNYRNVHYYILIIIITLNSYIHFYRISD